MKKRLLPMMLSCIMVLLMLPATVMAATPTEIMTISSENDLKAFAESVNMGNTYEGKTVTLVSDITLSDEWTPIGTGTRDGFSYTGNPFKGIFNGGNYTISGLTINIPNSNEDYAFGLFGVVDGGTVKNLKLTDVISMFLPVKLLVVLSVCSPAVVQLKTLLFPVLFPQSAAMVASLVV